MVRKRKSRKRAVKKKTGKSSLGTKWTSDKEGVSVTWPSIPMARGLGWFGAFVSAIWSMSWYLAPSTVGAYRSLILLGVLASVLLIVISLLFEESLSISSERVQRRRFSGWFRAMQAAPTDQVINAIVELAIQHESNNNPRVGYVKLRIRRSDGIEWWPVGTQMTWNEAKSLGRCLNRFTKLRVIRSEEARNA